MSYRVRSTVWICALLILACRLASTAAPSPVAPKASKSVNAPLWLRTPHLWRIDDGLPQNVVKCEVQSADGYIWMATQEGIGRFDGNRFTDFTVDNTPGLASNNVHELMIDKTGAMWVLAGGGLSRYVDGKFVKLIAVEPGMDSVQYVWSAPDGGVMVACERTLRRWENGGLKVVTNLVDTALRNTDFFSHAVQDKAGDVWLNDRFGDLISIDTSGSTRVIKAGGVFARLHAHANCVDAAGNVWTAGDNGVFKIVDGIPKLTVPEAALQTSNVWRMMADNTGDVWVQAGSSIVRVHNGTAQKMGAAQGIRGDVTYLDVDNAGEIWVQDVDIHRLYMWNGSHFEDCTIPEAMCWAWVNPILRDRDGGIWLGTYGGLCSLRPTLCRTFNAQDGLTSDNVRSVCVDATGRIWAGTDFGDLFKFNAGKFESLRDPALARRSITCLAGDADGSLWVVGNGDLFNVANGRSRAMKPALGLATEYIQSMTVDRSNRLWLGTPSGIACVQRSSTGAYSVKRYGPHEGAPSEFIPVIAPGRNGEIWLGANKSLTLFKDGSFKRYDTTDGLPAVPIIAVYEDTTGTAWIGSWGEGLYRLKDGKITRIGVDNGLYAGSVQGNVEVGVGSLVIASSKGLFLARLDAVNGCADGRNRRVSCTPLTLSDGDVGGVCSQGNQPILAVDRDGAIWAAAQHGALRYSPEPQAAGACPTYIERAILNGKEYSPSKTADVPPGNGALSFRFTSVDFTRMNEARFRYRLEGFDKSWQPSVGRDVDYTNLPPGNYRFEVTEIDNHGVPIGRMASMSFRINPHWYETGLFRFWLVCAFIAVGFSLGYLRMRTLAKQNRLLEAKVSERTAELVDTNSALLHARDELSEQNDHLQCLQSELEAQNDELQNAKAILEIQNRDLETAQEQLARQNVELNNLATTDGLTSLTNRRAFMERLEVEWKSAIRYGLPLSIALLDVDHFKQFNDTFGHQAGDAVLVEVGRALAECARDTDLPARYGGEEFVVILPHTDSTGAVAIAERIREAVEAIDGLPRTVTASCGVASLSVSMMSPEALIEAADRALYQSKHAGRNRVTLASADVDAKAA